MAAERRVNVYTAQWQQHPDITKLADGSLLVVWDSFFFEGDLDVYYIAGRRLAADGTPLSDEWVLSDPTLHATHARVDALPDGGFAVSWEAAPGSILNAADIFTRGFDADGTARGAPVRVNPAVDDYYFAAETVATATGYLTFYTKYHEGPDDAVLGNGIYMRAFSADGTPLGPARPAHPQTRFDQQVVRADQLSNGDVVAIWDSQLTTINEAGNPVDDVRGRIYAPDGTPRGPVFLVSPKNSGLNGAFDYAATDIAVAALTGGRFVAAWYEVTTGDGPTRYEIQARIFSSEGRPVGPEFVVNTHVSDIPGETAITALQGGGFLVTWSIWPEPGGDYHEIHGQFFTESGARHGTEFRINDLTAGDQEWPSAVALPDGSVAVVFASEAIDGDDTGISLRILEPGETEGPIRGGPGADALAGGPGHDTIQGLGGADTLTGLGGNDLLQGGAGADRLYGHAGRDTLQGGAGDDLLVGGAGNDILVGGGGADVFLFSGAVFGNDTVRDFVPRADNTVHDVLRFAANTNEAGSFSAFVAASRQEGADVVYDLHDDGVNMITLKNIALTDLRPQDFDFA